MKQPWYFEVNEYGTIVEADDTGPEVNSDVYEDIDVKGLLTPENIIAEVDQYDELRERFQERCGRFTDIPLIASKRRGNATCLVLIEADNNVNVVCEPWLTIDHGSH